MYLPLTCLPVVSRFCTGGVSGRSGEGASWLWRGILSSAGCSTSWACAGGVWKTEDGGTYWENVSDGYFETASVGAVAVSQSDPNVVYAGTGEACIRGNVSHGDGVYRSTDGGRTWRNMGLRDTRHIARVRVHPSDPDVAYVAALGHAFGPNDERGVFRTTDGGETWERVLDRGDRAGAADLCMDPGNPRVLYAATWETLRQPWSFTSGGPGSGIFRSTDGGDTWDDLTCNRGLPEGVKGRIGVAVSPAMPGRVWAIVEAEGGRAVPLRRRWRDVAASHRRREPDAAALVLQPRVRRPAGREHGVGAQPEGVEVDGRREHVHAGDDAARRQPRPVDRPERHAPDDRGERRRGVRVVQRRRVVVVDLQPADGPVLPRSDRRPVPLPCLRDAAGQLGGQRPEPLHQGGDRVEGVRAGGQLGVGAHRGEARRP